MNGKLKPLSEVLPVEPVCFTCPYYGETDSGESRCKRHAPSAVIITEDLEEEPLTYWPEVDPIDFCGEHPLMPKYIDLLTGSFVLYLGTLSSYGREEADAYRQHVVKLMSEIAESKKKKQSDA